MGERGQPTKYRKEYNEQAKKLCLLGATDVQLADFFEVCEATLNNWKKEHPKFLESIKEAKLEKDNAVERSLYERAMGYSHPEDKIFNHGGEAMVVATTKHYAPDTTAAMFWLQNRQPEKWRNVKHIDHTTQGEKLPGPNLSDEDLLRIAGKAKE